VTPVICNVGYRYQHELKLKGIFDVGSYYDKGIGIENNKHKAFIYHQKSTEMRTSLVD